MEFINPKFIINALVFSIIGVVIFWLSFLVIDKVTPAYNLWKELVEEKNIAVAIVVAAMCLGIAIIVAASVHG